jgi:hypothetical protein
MYCLGLDILCTTLDWTCAGQFEFTMGTGLDGLIIDSMMKEHLMLESPVLVSVGLVNAYFTLP